MRVRVVDVPYDSGRFDVRMGRGPGFLIARGLHESLRRAGHDVRSESARLPERFHTEWDALALLQQQVAASVRSALAAGERPLIFSGTCGPASLGAIAGLRGRPTGVCWFDAHADFNTPDTSPSGFLDGMALAIAAGHCWREAALRLDPFDPVREEHVIQIGVRAADPGEQDRLGRSSMARLGTGDSDRLPDLLARMPVAGLYLHIDLDVIDPAELRANSYAETRGLSVDQLISLISTAGDHVPIAAASITALDPDCDPDRAWPVVERIVHTICSVESL